MAVIARCEVTLAVAVDVASVTTWYRIQPSVSQPPAKPDEEVPNGWSPDEPAYDGATTDTLYTCQRTMLTDGTFMWGSVCVSSSYEAAKHAANEASAASSAVNDALAAADAAQELAEEAQEDATEAISAASVASAAAEAAMSIAEASGQHFWTDDAGVHVTEAERGEWDASETKPGANALLNSEGLLFRDGEDDLLAITAGDTPGVAIYNGAGSGDDDIIASFTGDGIVLGSSAAPVQLVVASDRLSFLEDAQEVAFASGGEFYAPNMTVDSKLSLSSGEGDWAWVPRDNGNLALKWIG